MSNPSSFVSAGPASARPSTTAAAAVVEDGAEAFEASQRTQVQQERGLTALEQRLADLVAAPVPNLAATLTGSTAIITSRPEDSSATPPPPTLTTVAGQPRSPSAAATPSRASRGRLPHIPLLGREIGSAHSEQRTYWNHGASTSRQRMSNRRLDSPTPWRSQRWESRDNNYNNNNNNNDNPVGGEYEEDEYTDDEVNDDDNNNSMPDLQSGPPFESTTDANNTTVNPSYTTNDSSSTSPSSTSTAWHAGVHTYTSSSRPPYVDASTFIHDNPHPSSNPRHELRRTTGFPTSHPRIRRAAEILSRQGLGSAGNSRLTQTIVSSNVQAAYETAHRQLDRRSSREAVGLGSGATPGTSMEAGDGDYTGWAPGTTSNEHARPTLSTLRAMARGHGRMGSAGVGASSSSRYTQPREPTSLERRYWAEQHRREMRQALEQQGEPWGRDLDGHEYAGPMVHTQGSPTEVPAYDANASSGATGELPGNPRSIVYNPPSRTPTQQQRADIYDLHRELEESYQLQMQEREAQLLSNMSRLQRVEARLRARDHEWSIRRAGPSTGGGGGGGNGGAAEQGANQFDNVRSGLYDLHRDLHVDAPGSNETTRRWVEQGIKYLEQLRHCNTYAERIAAANEAKFIQGDYRTEDHEDFLLDTTVVEPPPKTSWLVPGTVFSGSQHAATVSTLGSYVASTQAGRQRAGEYSSRMAALNATDAGVAATRQALRSSWVDSVMQRDRHTGASVHSTGLSGAPAAASATTTAATTSQPPQTGPDSSTHVPNNTSRTTNSTRAENEDTWPVKVTITSVDYDKMTLTGTMEAMNVPNKSNNNAMNSTQTEQQQQQQQSTITTFLEGEIIDLNKYSLETIGFNADSVVDSTYWRRLEPFKSLNDAEIVSRLVSIRWLTGTVGREYVLMRWKEKCFVTPSDAGMGLTISGFYYISLNRQTGRIEGLYYDPQSSPYQHLCLDPQIRRFSTYTFT